MKPIWRQVWLAAVIGRRYQYIELAVFMHYQMQILTLTPCSQSPIVEKNLNPIYKDNTTLSTISLSL